MKKNLLFLACAVFLGAGCEQSTENIPAVSGFDLNKYMGEWYEVARLPNRFEKDMTQVTAFYTTNPDGTVQVRNQGIRNYKISSVDGKARQDSEAAGTGELEVTFFWPFYSMYRVIWLDPDYQTSVVTGANKDFLWILSRTPVLQDDEKKSIMDFLEQHDYPVGNLIYSWE